MAEETKKTPQTPEEIAREAQGSGHESSTGTGASLVWQRTGFEGTDLMKMHEKTDAGLGRDVPGRLRRHRHTRQR